MPGTGSWARATSRDAEPGRQPQAVRVGSAERPVRPGPGPDRRGQGLAPELGSEGRRAPAAATPDWMNSRRRCTCVSTEIDEASPVHAIRNNPARCSHDRWESLDRLRADRRAATDPRDRARLHRQGDRPARARERPQRALRHRARAEDRGHRLPRRDRARGVRRPRRGLPHLRADRRGGRAAADSAMRTVVSVRHLARLLVDRALGHRGAEAGVAAAGSAPARRSAASA